MKCETWTKAELQSQSTSFDFTTLHNYINSINDPNAKQAGGVITTTALGAKKKPKSLREKNRFGTVIVKVASLSSNRRVQERQNIFTITPRGALFHGTQCNPALVQKGLSYDKSEYNVGIDVRQSDREWIDMLSFGWSFEWYNIAVPP